MSFGIWNNLDEFGLYLGLERLSYETDEDYYNRLKKFATFKYKTDYYTQAHSVPLQLGLETYDVFRLECYTTIEGKRVDIPYVCKVDWEYFTLESFPGSGLPAECKEYFRVFINNKDATLKKILDILDNSNIFTYNILEEKYKRLPCSFLIRGTNIAIGRDYISEKSTILANKNIILETFASEDSEICKKRETSFAGLNREGDYFIDPKAGYLQVYGTIYNGFYVTYQYYKPYFAIEASELSLVPIKTIAKYGMTDKMIEYTRMILENKVWG